MKNFLLFVPLAVLSIGLGEQVVCLADIPYGQEGEAITLSQAIERGLVQNRDVQDQKLLLRLSEIYYQNAWDTMFLPTVSLSLGTASYTTLTHIPGDTNERVKNTTDSRGYPYSYAILNLGSYSFYNFGRDRLTYDQALLTWQRAKEGLDESIRGIKFQIIVAYWTLKTSYDKVDSANRSIEIAQAMADLQESRFRLGKATKADFESSSIDVFAAKNLKDQLETNSKIALFALNTLLGDPIGTKYRIDEEISFLPISLNEDLVYETYQKNSPNMKTARSDLKKAELALTLEQRNRIPLPTFSFSGITVSYQNHYYGNTPDLYTGYTGNVNFNVSASVGLTIPLLGPGGFLSSRTVESAEIGLDRAELKLKDLASKDRSQIFQFIQNIRQGEITVKNNRESLVRSVNVMESVFQRYFNGAVSRLELRDAITQARSVEISLSESTLGHLRDKMQMAQLLGVDYLPRLDQ